MKKAYRAEMRTEVLQHLDNANEQQSVCRPSTEVGSICLPIQQVSDTCQALSYTENVMTGTQQRAPKES